ncbi:lasso peptide biosynthesis B2 protein [Streptomyces platensis]|uniref:lasso peptide biosynthesis B2 protein n=1 Tax=Streptomyces platensis TaxID=58346 RepID=UPI002E810882|nr:lasso peptide biosynthesis B2 protein [Streptomyces platensis]WSW55020.1 lasso peptide biosynthesis B2 protein [Streptomyces platensis]WUB79321.1 lasso peptide biosynthesis B2 protein [Streptomyces platensis]
MIEPSRFATAPAHVRALDFGHITVLLNYRNGHVQCLLPAVATLWRNTAATGRLDLMPSVLVNRLLATGLLVRSVTPIPWPAPLPAKTATASWGSAEHPAGALRPAPTRTTAGATAALAMVFAIKRLGSPNATMHRLTTALRRAVSTCRQPATHDQAQAAVLAVRRAGWYSPARTACLEESAAAVLLLAARRLSTTWCHGIAPDPVRLHAWVQTDRGAPAAEPPSTLAYTAALTIGARHQHQL